jgi:hypothetical protein
MDNFRSACSARGSSISIIYRDRDVSSNDSGNYAYDAC